MLNDRDPQVVGNAVLALNEARRPHLHRDWAHPCAAPPLHAPHHAEQQRVASRRPQSAAHGALHPLVLTWPLPAVPLTAGRCSAQCERGWAGHAHRSSAYGRGGQVLLDKGGLEAKRETVLKLLQRFNEFNEWVQYHVLELVAKYNPADPNEALPIAQRSLPY